MIQRTLRPILLLFVFGLVLAGAVPSQAQSVRSQQAGAPNDTNPSVMYLAEYQNGTLSIHVFHEDGYHTYDFRNTERGGLSTSTTISVTGGLRVSGSWKAVPESKYYDPFNLGADYAYSGETLFTIPATLTGEDSAKIAISGQVCDIGGCLPFDNLTLTLTGLSKLSAGSAAATTGSESEQPSAQTSGQESAVVAEGSPRFAFVQTVNDANDNPVETTLVTFEAFLTGDRLVVSANIAQGWKLFGLDNFNPDANRFAASLTFTLGGSLEATGPWMVTPPVTLADEVYYNGRAAFAVPVKVVGSGPTQISVTGVVDHPEGDSFNIDGHMTLNSVPPILRSLAASETARGEYTKLLDTLGVKGLELPSKASGTEGLDNAGSVQLVNVRDRWVLSEWGGSVEDVSPSMWALIWLAITGGLIALLMPCVYPMIPITVSFFSKQAEKSGGSTEGLGLVYGAGVMTTYTGLGLALTAALGATGASQFGNSVWVAGGVAVFFLIFGLSMLGAFELRLPSGLAQKFNVQGKSSGATGAFLLGSTFAVTSMACTVPVVGTILALAATGGGYIQPTIGMLVYSGVVALPFVLLAMIPGALKKLPKAGGWMNSVKVVFGFVELAAAAEFFGWTRLISRQWVLAIWVACFLLAALYLLGTFRAKHDAPVQGLGAGRMVFATIFFSIALWILPGLFGANLGFVESFLRSDATGTWVVNPDLESVLADARDKRKSVFIDITGHN